MAELTKLTGTYIRSGSIPTTALSGGVVSSSLQIISALPTGSVSSSAQVAELLPVGTVSSSTQVDYTVLSNVPAGIASSSTQVTAYLPTDTVSSSGQVTAFLPTNTVSSSGQVTAFLPTGTVSQSAQIDITGTTNYTSFSSSLATVDTAQTNRLTTLESVTGSYATTGSNTFVAPQTISDTTNSTSYLDGALHVAGGMSVRKDVRISGSMTINGLLTAVSMSTQYVTSSQYNVGVSRITLNDDDNVRFAGLSIIDSGSSSPTSASIFWDSLQHRFIYENLSGSNYNSSIIIAGPKHTGSLGDESTLTSGYVPYATGGDHIDNSVIYQSGSNIGIGTTNPGARLEVTAPTSTAATFKLNAPSYQDLTIEVNSATIDFKANSTNDMRFMFGGTERVRFDDTGNVGIGTTTPDSPLHILKTGSGLQNFITLDNPQSTANGVIHGIRFEGHTDSRNMGGLQMGSLDSTGDNYYMSLHVRDASNTVQERLRILRDGNIGIGTTDPGTNKLFVDGVLYVNNRAIIQSNFASYTGDGLFDANARPSIVVTPNGHQRIRFGYNDEGNGLYWGRIGFLGNTNWSIGHQQFGNHFAIGEGVNGTAISILSGSNNVGIGTAIPAAKLGIQGSSGTGVDGGVLLDLYGGTISAADNGVGISFTRATSQMAYIQAARENASNEAAYLRFATQTSAGTHPERMRIDSSGNVGIGKTNPEARLHVVDSNGQDGTIKLGGSESALGLVISYSQASATTTQIISNPTYTNSSAAMILRVDGDASATTNQLYLRGDGFVGIGIANPTVKLTVSANSTDVANGQIRAVGASDSAKILALGYHTTDNYGYVTALRAGTGYSPLILNGEGGNVGIGTTNPGSTLDVLGGAIVRGSNGSGAISVGTSSGRGQYQYINLGGTTGGTDYGWQIGRSPNTGGIINDGFYIYDIKTNNAPFTIALGGNVGIGVANPTDGVLQTKDAGVSSTNTYLGTGRLRIGGGSDHSTNVVLSVAPGVVQFDAAGVPGGRLIINSSGNIGIGTTNPGSYKLYVQGDQYISGTLTEASSIALKENINPITDALSIIKNITGYTYDRKDGTAINQSGLIAEEVAEILPGVVSRDQEGNPSGVQYTKIIAYLVESIKELKSELDELKRQ